MFSAELQKQAESILDSCKRKNLKLATAESCTGGLLAALFTEIPGSSAVFAGGVVSYSNALKHTLLGVSEEALENYGAVSQEVAQQMASGARKRLGVDIAISITGIAGPDGGTLEKPVGLVYIGLAAGNNIHAEKNNFTGSRSDIRMQAVAAAMAVMESVIA